MGTCAAKVRRGDSGSARYASTVDLRNASAVLPDAERERVTKLIHDAIGKKYPHVHEMNCTHPKPSRVQIGRGAGITDHNDLPLIATGEDNHAGR